VTTPTPTQAVTIGVGFLPTPEEALSDSWGKMYIWLPGNGRVKRGNGRSAAEGMGAAQRREWAQRSGGNWLAYSKPIPSATLRPLLNM
jgi:hypothetical protein